MKMLWPIAGAVALLWPGRVVGPLDGMPLDGASEAVMIGLLVPSLWWFDRGWTRVRWVQALICLLLAWKVGSSLIFTQQGLCLTTSAGRAINGINQGIPIIEPQGFLRSWDVRADWRAAQPRCTAIVTRGLATGDAFPAWFVNVTDSILDGRDFMATLRGTVGLPAPGRFTLASAGAMRVAGTIGGANLSAGAIDLQAGSHAMDLTMRLGGDDWRFEPLIDGRPLAGAALVTTDRPTAVDRWFGRPAKFVSPILVSLLTLGLLARSWARVRHDGRVLAAAAALSIAAIVLAKLPGAWPRLAGAIGFAAIAVPVCSRLRNLRGAFLLIGVPWLAFIAARSLGQIGRYSVYSVDDWLAYQVAGYRIYMHGFWLEGGNAVFDFQPLYRWMTGALHLVFGDSSVGELYWDAACLLSGALLAFQLVRQSSGYRWGIAAAAAALATFTLGTPWYFIGRGLSEIAAAGWAFAAIFLVLRSRKARPRWVMAGGFMAVLMFDTRMNHLLLAVFLPAFLMPIRTTASALQAWRAFGRFCWARAALFLGVFGAGVVAFMARTWHYTGEFSLFLGTSLRHNDTGLRPWTLVDPQVWSKVSHSLAATIWMNEPPAPDLRAVFVLLGVLVATAAIAQTAVAQWVPAAAVIGLVGTLVGAFFAHAHGYPGRFSIHVVPFACALTMAAASRLTGRPAGQQAKA
jgi:hypothetical protein